MNNPVNSSEKSVQDTNAAKDKDATKSSAEKERLDNALVAAKARRAALLAGGSRTEADRERAEDLGGLRLKLSVQGRIEGYHLYWENDQDGAIETLLFEGFEFAEPAEVKMQSAFVADADLGNRVSRYVGRKEDGSPLRAYLMKCPDEIWETREQRRYAQADNWDAAIHQSINDRSDGRYKPAGVNSKIERV